MLNPRATHGNITAAHGDGILVFIGPNTRNTLDCEWSAITLSQSTSPQMPMPTQPWETLRPLIHTSARRLAVRPAAVLLLPTGLAVPLPVVKKSGGGRSRLKLRRHYASWSG